MLAGCAAQNAYRESQTLLAEGKVDAGLAKIQEAMVLDPASLEYRLAYERVVDGEVIANLAKADRALALTRYDEAEAAYRRVRACSRVSRVRKWVAARSKRSSMASMRADRSPRGTP